MFEHIRTEQHLREAVAEGSRARRKAARWTVASTKLAVAGAACVAIAVWTHADLAALAGMVAVAGAALTGVPAYWGWRRVRDAEDRVVEIASAFSERVIRWHVERDVGPVPAASADRADASAGRVSVLAPVGAALLGLRTGDSIEWPLPDGRHARIRILSVAQPQAVAEEAAA
jgi:hypothetical protein